MKAHDLADKPTKDVRDAMKDAAEQSAASESMTRIELLHDDGSVLTVASFQGADATLHPSDDGIELDDDGSVGVYATPVDVPSPRLPDSPAPQGIDEEGNTIGEGDDDGR